MLSALQNYLHDVFIMQFDGWIALEGDKPEASKVFIEIDLGSAKTDSEKLSVY